MTTVLITGANRGLGLQFARHYAAEGCRVLATCRDPEGAEALRSLKGDVQIHALDVADFSAIGRLARTLEGEAIDILVNNAGLMSRGHHFGEIDYDNWETVLRVNLLAPVAMAESFLAHLERGKGKRIALLSSLMGSIADNGSGGYYGYRSSKAALNAAGHSLALDLARKGILVLILHPGWVRTDMGGASAPLGAEEAVRGLCRGIADATMEHSGRFFAHDGRELPW